MRKSRRRDPRLPVCRIYGSMLRPLDVRLLDLSRRGVGFETAHRLTVGERYFLEVTHAGRTVNLELRIKWCSQRRESEDPEAKAQSVVAGGAFLEVWRDADDGFWSSVQADVGRATES